MPGPRVAPPPAAYVYGPVPSRRLGISLGIDLLPKKTCSFDCVYCQLGRGTLKTSRRRAFVPAARILADVKKALAANERIDHITFSGSGEPTLHARIGDIIRGLKKITKVPVAVLTNSSLLTLKPVRDSLSEADIVVPSLDAATVAVFRKVNRPLPSISLERIIRGLVSFRKMFKGKIWLEVMLVKGVNDSVAHLAALKKAIARVRPDKVQLNTVTRPPAETWARPLNASEMEAVRRTLGGKAQVVVDFKDRPQATEGQDLKTVLYGLIRRRPVTLEDMVVSLGKQPDVLKRRLQELIEEKKVKQVLHKSKYFFEPL